MRIAAIDIGTNSIHMVIVTAIRHGGFEVVDREREVVQVGAGSFGVGRLRRDAIRRTAAALRRFVQLARRQQVDKILCTATAAVREAENGGEFLDACREAAGITPRVIPAEAEGRFVDLAVRAALRLPDEPVLVVDIGGGSMQLALGRGAGGERRSTSAPLGALRLTETWIQHDPATPREIERLRRMIRKRVRAASRALDDPRPGQLCGASGAIHALAHVTSFFERGEPVRRVGGHVLERDALARTMRRLLRMPLDQRERLPGIDDKRAEILVAGGLVLLEVLDRFGARTITLSDFGVREGVVIDWLQRHAAEVSALEPVEDLRERSALGLLARLGMDGPHPRHVAALSRQLFDGLVATHGLGPAERDLLQLAALLHDVGTSIGYDRHAEHSAYVIRNASLRGLSEADVECVALVARYHGKRAPKRNDRDYRDLRKSERRTVRWLSAMLRVAEGLDRSHYQLVRSLRVSRRGDRVTVFVDARRDAQLEAWASRRRLSALDKLIGGRVRIAAERVARDVQPASRPARRAAAPRAETAH